MNMESTVAAAAGQSTQSSWLGFSLSNQHHHHIMNNINSLSSSSCSSDSSHQLCLFEAFHQHHPSSAPSATAVRTTAAPEDVGGRAADHTMFTSGTSGPKLEDFLGGCTADIPPPPPPHAQLLGGGGGGHLSNIPAVISDSASELYDSELKTIAASFLRGFSSTVTEQPDARNQQQQQQYRQQSLVQTELAPKKSIDTFGQRTSIYRGVTRHRWTGRYEAHLWDNSCRREGQSRKGRQVYLGGYDKEEKAARAYDLAALKYWGPTTTTNFPVSNYEKELVEMKNMTRQEFVASLRRKSSGFSRGASIYRGVTRHHQHGRWQARIGRVAGNKDLYLGTFSTQEEAAEAYDIAAIKFRGLNAVTNFDISRYDVKSIANSNLPINGLSTKSKNSSESASDSKSIDGSRSDDLSSASSVTFAPASNTTLSFAIPIKQDPSDYWSSILRNQINTASTTLHNAKNNNGSVAPSTFFQPSAINNRYALQFQSPTASFRTDLKTNPSFNDGGNNSGLFFNPGFIQQQSGSGVAGVSGSGNRTNATTSSSSLQFATPIALSGSASSYEGNSSYDSWIAQTSHSFQSAKPNLSVFQTPIFGME